MPGHRFMVKIWLKQVIFILLLIFTSISYGQNKCFCENEPDLIERVPCDTTILKNKSQLYYQFNCDSVWLTLDNNQNKVVIFSMGTELAGYTYRLGYLLTKEFKNSLLFRWSCPANGPCNYVLLDKNTGKILQHYNELIYKAQDSLADFIIYFTNDNLSSLTIDFIDRNKKYQIAVDSNKFRGINPEYQFEEAVLDNDKLKMTYSYLKNETDTNYITENIEIDLKKYQH